MTKNSKRTLASVLALLALAGCSSAPNLRYGMEDATDTFKSRQLTNGGKVSDGGSSESMDGVTRPRRKLVQFRYSATSFQNSDFQAFLQRLSTEGTYLSDEVSFRGPQTLSPSEKVLVSQERSSKRRMLVVREMRKLQAQLNSYGMSSVPTAWKGHMELNFRGATMSMVLGKLAQQSHVDIQVSERARNSRVRVNGLYKGNLLEVLRQLSSSYGVQVRVGVNDQSLNVLNSDEVSSPIYASTEYFNPYAHTITDPDSLRELESYRELVGLLSTGDTEIFNRRLAAIKPPLEQGVISSAYEKLVRGGSGLNQLLKTFDQESLAIQNGLIPNANVSDQEVTNAIMSKGILDRGICPGQEIVTEKLFVYQESPKEIVKFLDGYFKSNIAQAPLPAAVASSSATPQALTPQAVTPTPVVSPASSKRARSEFAQDRCNVESDSVAFKVIEDPTGVIVTGTVPQIELAARLTNDVDLATKQVLAEVFLVEVQKNWERTIETKLGGTGGGSSASKSIVSSGKVTNAFDTSGNVATVASAVNGVLAAGSGSAVGGIAGAQGKFTANGGDISAFINLLETNSVGRNISSPTLVAKNGEEAEISKVITLRKTITTAIPGAGTPVNPTTIPNQQVQKLEVPLKLKIKPSINQHNKHVTLRFDYEETVLLPAEDGQSSIERGTTKNLITTTFETAPGDVVVLAGLFKEANSNTTSSLPGLSSAGAWAALLGGGDSVASQSTELLVFVKPTVIEPRATPKNMNSNR